MLFADCGGGANVPCDAEYRSGNIAAPRKIADVFGDLFFSAIRSLHTGLDRYVRNNNTASISNSLTNVML